MRWISGELFQAILLFNYRTTLDPVELELLGRRAAPGPLRLRPAGTRAGEDQGSAGGIADPRTALKAGCSRGRGSSDPPGGPFRLSRPGSYPFVPSFRWARPAGRKCESPHEH